MFLFSQDVCFCNHRPQFPTTAIVALRYAERGAAAERGEIISGVSAGSLLQEPPWYSQSLRAQSGGDACSIREGCADVLSDKVIFIAAEI